MTRKIVTNKGINYRQQLVNDLKEKYDCSSCGYILSGELQIWFKKRICIVIKTDELEVDNYRDVLTNVCKNIDKELMNLGIKTSENEIEVPE